MAALVPGPHAEPGCRATIAPGRGGPRPACARRRQACRRSADARRSGSLLQKGRLLAGRMACGSRARRGGGGLRRPGRMTPTAERMVGEAEAAGARLAANLARDTAARLEIEIAP